jgi:amino acid adenylation domain-containing protein
MSDFEIFEKTEICQAIHQRFEKQARKFAHRVAVLDPERILTYEALDYAANNIARAILGKVGDKSGQVAFVLPSNAYAIMAILGILKAGKAYVPLDPLFPKERTRLMLEHSESTLILTDHEHRELATEISGGSTPMLVVEEIDLKKRSDNLNVNPEPESMAYILYTSGSTGKPKGIAFSHRNLLHTTMCLINSLHIRADDRMTQLHSTSFAASVVDIYCSLLSGASVLPWDVKARGVTGLATWLIQKEVTSIQWIPTPFRQLIETLQDGERFRTVRLLVMASEPLTRREFDLYRRHFPDSCSLVNQMGTSESYNYYLFFANKETVFEGSRVPAGYPVSEDREVLLLDDDKNEVRPGEIGEIAIRSEYMSLGYWRDAPLTSRAFLPDPKGTEKKMYLTGDLGRRLPDGCLLHLGRKDFQVKIRGYRIELTEVEFAIRGMEHIRDIAVMARPDHQGELKLVAYYQVDNDKELNASEFREKLSKKLPDYMIPSIFIKMQEFPMTPTGKLDRNSLPAPDNRRPLLENELVLARTATENTLTEIWREVLQREEVGVTDNFFELGGDSLQAATMLHFVDARCGVDLGYSMLVQTPRIADIAVLIEALRNSGSPLVAEGSPAGRPREKILHGLINRVLQVIALYAPGLTTLRVWLHRLRGVRIGANVAIGTAAIIETAHPEFIWIGDNVAVGIRNVILGHFGDSINLSRGAVGPTVRICNNVYIGPNVTILPNVTIGEGAVVTAGSVVNKSVAPRMMVQGNPARPIAICDVPLIGGGHTYEDFIKHVRPLDGVPVEPRR